MDRPCVTEMDRGGVYEMDGQTKWQKMEIPVKWIKFNKICWTGTRMCYYILSISLAFPFLAPPLFISVTLGRSIHSIETSFTVDSLIGRKDSSARWQTTLKIF